MFGSKVLAGFLKVVHRETAVQGSSYAALVFSFFFLFKSSADYERSSLSPFHYRGPYNRPLGSGSIFSFALCLYSQHLLSITVAFA
jgi:hypothetical protein